MLGLGAYRIVEAQGSVGFDFVDPGSGKVVGEARPGKVRWGKWSFWRMLGLSVPSPESRPRLDVRRTTDGRNLVFRLRKASGLMYDSRMVYGGQGELIAELNGGFKSAVGKGMRFVDMRGVDEAVRDNRIHPWLGHVLNKDGVFLAGLVGCPHAGTVTPRLGRDARQGTEKVDGYDVELGPEAATSPLGRETGTVLLLAAALTLAWSPPVG